MRKRSAFGWIAAASLLFGGVAACSDDPEGGCAQEVVTSDQSCAVSADCTAAGLDLTCINGTCRLACRTDADCDLVANADPFEDPECRADPNSTPAAICQAGQCELGCPDIACQGTEECFDGRCVVYAEGFEVPADRTGVDLRLLGFNDPPGELANTRTGIGTVGIEGCTPGRLDCAGPAAQGANFVVLESEPTPPKGTPVPGVTCRACACCLECQADPNVVGVGNINVCPVSPDIQTPLACFEQHPNCQEVCDLCETTCPASGRPVASLLSCEQTAADRSCSLCEGCDDAFLQDCRNSFCAAECAGGASSPECSRCNDERCLGQEVCQICRVCREAKDCDGEENCNQLRDDCDDQRPNGCFDVPIDYLRAQLFDGEQALTSPEIDLSGAGSDLVMEFDYVSFDIGTTYFPGQQGVPPDQWTEATQEVRVQFCAGSCEPGAWVDAIQVNGISGVLPSDNQRNNARLLGDQTIIDWRVGRVRLGIPPELQTATFRYRFLPRLADGSRLGVDNILIRRAP